MSVASLSIKANYSSESVLVKIPITDGNCVRWFVLDKIYQTLPRDFYLQSPNREMNTLPESLVVKRMGKPTTSQT